MDYHGGMVTRLNQSEFIKTALRLPPDVHAMLHNAAEASGRSYNAEIVARLQQSFEQFGQGDKISAAFDSLQDEIRQIKAAQEKLLELRHPTGQTDAGES